MKGLNDVISIFQNESIPNKFNKNPDEWYLKKYNLEIFPIAYWIAD
jgi:hypothetical protein